MKKFIAFNAIDQLDNGPSIWLKMSINQRFGSSDETGLYHELCRLSLNGGPFVVIPSENVKDTTVILAFEFMRHDPISEPIVTDLRERAQGYAKALGEMANNDYVAIDHNDLNAMISFGRGFKNSSII